jgi:hypothetical protein
MTVEAPTHYIKNWGCQHNRSTQIEHLREPCAQHGPQITTGVHAEPRGLRDSTPTIPRSSRL